MGHSDWRLSPRPTFPVRHSAPPRHLTMSRPPPTPPALRCLVMGAPSVPALAPSAADGAAGTRRHLQLVHRVVLALALRLAQHAVAAAGDRQAAGDFERLLLRLARGGGAGADGCGPAPRPPARGGRSSSGATSSKARAARRTVSRCHPKHPGGVVVQRDSLPPCCDPCSKAAVRALPFPHHPSAPQLHRVRRHTATTFLPAAQPRIRDLRTGRAFLPSV